MRASFFSMHNPRNTLVMYMMGLIIIGAFYTFEYYETIAVALATGIIFSTLLPFYQHSIDELVLNNLASIGSAYGNSICNLKIFIFIPGR